MVIVGSIAGMLGLVLPLTASPATAAACYYTSCNGRDPQSTGCSSGARTLTKIPDWEVSGARVELRYSPSCHAVWTRIDNYAGLPGVAKVIGYYGGGYREELKTLAAYKGEVAWTNMVSDAYVTYACIRRWADRWYEICSTGH
jgi:hypothetical protein